MKYQIVLALSRDLAIELLTKEDYKMEDLRKLSLEELMKVGVDAEVWSLPQ